MESGTGANGKARAKINLFLDVTGKREDGYHLIDGVMQTVTLADLVTVQTVPADAPWVSLAVRGEPGLPTDEGNLAVRAAWAFLRQTGLRIGVRIGLDKHIPMAGGLAGGSTDAAQVLLEMNRLTGTPLNGDALCRLGLTLGADVPFCIAGRAGAMRTEGIGEKLTALPPLPDCGIVIAKAGEGVSTPWAYRVLDESSVGPQSGRRETALRLEMLMQALRTQDLDRVCASAYNIFEQAVIPVRPEVSRLKTRMREGGAKLAMMSGSGPSVFGIFETVGEAERECARIREDGITAHVCRPVRGEFF